MRSIRPLLAIAGFEFRARVKLLSTWVYFIVFFALTMLWMAAAGGLFESANVSFGSGKVAVNSPFALAITTSVLGLLGTVVMAAIMGRAVQQDFEYRTQNFFFTAPIHKAQYLGGRFVGALGVVLVVFTSIALGALCATALPGMDPSRLGPNRFAAYALPLLYVLLPNALLIGGAFFSLAALTRRMLPVYVGSVLVIIGWLLSRQLFTDLDQKWLAALVDITGSRALSNVTEYWTIAERNVRLIPFEGALVWNRSLWLGVALVLCALCFWRFSFTAAAQERVAKAARQRAEAKTAADAEPSGPASGPAAIDTTRPLRLLPHLVWLNLRETVKNIYFGVLVLAGVLFMIFASTNVGSSFGTNTWPVTFQMTGLVSGSFALFMLIIVTFYAGELVWRERENRLDQIVDATPTPTWLPLVAKLLALMTLPALLQALLMVCGMGLQAAKGYYRFEPGVYLQALFGIDLLNYWLLCALAITVHSVVNQKYVAHFVMIVYYVLLLFASQLGLEHNLYKFASIPDAVYSDINGWGHFMPRVRAFQAYWAAGSLLLLVAAYLLWTRGSAGSMRERWLQARARVSAPVVVLAAAGLLVFGALGGWIFYNTNVLNVYETATDALRRQADYEKTYKRYAAEPQPKVVDVSVDVDLYPREQRVRMRGRYTLTNKNATPVEVVQLNFASGQALVIHRLEFGTASQLLVDDARIGVRRYRLAAPLAPGASTTLAFDLELPTHGFKNEGSNTAVVYNGSFVNGRLLLPAIGYNPDAELERDQDRRKFGLAPKERLPDRDDPKGLMINGLERDADYVGFETTLSTDADQVAIAPGYLQREWTEGGRRHFHYKMDAPIANFFSFQSGRYAVRKDLWHRDDGSGTGDVPIEIYYQPGHEFNLDSMLAATKAALSYNSRRFGPYQYRQFRIIEFPRYASFAQSFPNTIPYSEAIGFIARVDPEDPKDVDYPYYVTAHEAAHQWWGHQVMGGDVQGGSMLVETLAQYSALMVMRDKVGPAKMRKFLAYELNRYLLGRATEQKKELPLSRVEDQAYIHYAKGSLAMYALADYLGEDRLNQAIRTFRDAHAFKGPPYPSSSELVADIRAVAPPEMQYLADDLFERIVIYDNHAVSASAKPLAGGKYEVSVKVIAKKRVADELGKERDVALADLIDVGVLDAKGEPIVLERRRIDREQSTFTFTVDRKPAKAGIDPLNKLIDRKPDDNTVAVTIGGG
jgi:ABC-type transport system involved in multi-copper enzyme maturation permease subunit